MSNTKEQKRHTESSITFDSETGFLSQQNQMLFWHYLFIHHAKINRVTEKLQEKFNIFIHRSIVYADKKGVWVKKESPTISGLVFVQGESQKIQHYLDENFFGLHLAHDYCTNSIASISDSQMQIFMRIARMEQYHSIRFMLHPFNYYSSGHTLVRVTSGPLAGSEGYVIRVSRNKCLVISLGNMTLAISGICKESFENVDEYVWQRASEQQKEHHLFDDVSLSPIQKEIDLCFFDPRNALDIMAIGCSLDRWVRKASALTREHRMAEAAEITLFILGKIGGRFFQIRESVPDGNFKDLLDVSEHADEVLRSILQDRNLSVELKEYIVVERQSFVALYPFLPIGDGVTDIGDV